MKELVGLGEMLNNFGNYLLRHFKYTGFENRQPVTVLRWDRFRHKPFSNTLDAASYKSRDPNRLYTVANSIHA